VALVELEFLERVKELMENVDLEVFEIINSLKNRVHERFKFVFILVNMLFKHLDQQGVV
jgi:hypothetical protein